MAAPTSEWSRAFREALDQLLMERLLGTTDLRRREEAVVELVSMAVSLLRGRECNGSIVRLILETAREMFRDRPCPVCPRGARAPRLN